MEARLQTLGDFIANELESELRRKIFEFTAAHNLRAPRAAFLSKGASVIPSQAVSGVASHGAEMRVALCPCVLQVTVELGQTPYPTLSSLVKDASASPPFSMCQQDTNKSFDW